MANFNFNIADSSNEPFSVVLISETSTDCSTVLLYQVNSTTGNSITMELGQTYFHGENIKYIQSDVETFWDGSEITFNYQNDLYLSYSIGNSGVPGYFNKVKFYVQDNTTSASFNYASFQTIRKNDSLECDNPTGDGGTYDELTDTPDNKVGHGLKLVRVNVGETAHEYVDPGYLGNDLNYSEVFTLSYTWVVAHNLGKIPSVTIIDGSGNRVHGNVSYTDLNNLTVTFNTAFAGTIYLN
tara:strand:- start:19 stop:738 length:720 start_codon:yes stop_codon:yes gene_type:complete